jgi:hypothetical protein
MAGQLFQVFDIKASDSICTIEMDEELVNPDAGIINPENGSLSPLGNIGKNYTLVPIDSHKNATLKLLHETYTNITTKPATLFTTHFNRIDELIIRVGYLFKPMEFTKITNKDELLLVLKGKHHDLPTVKSDPFNFEE